VLREIHASPAVKIMQNGATYDTAFFLRHNVPMRNFFVDTQHIFHSIWTEAPKKLNFITSITNDYNRYWKDEAKGEKEFAYPRDAVKQDRYWRYNALDCHNMVIAAFELFRVLAKQAWARKNYAMEIELQLGPCLASMMTGMKVDSQRQTKLALKLLDEAERAHEDLLRMVGDPGFNPNSPQQFAQLLYDVLRATPIKMKGRNANKNERGTGEPVLKLLQQQHPLLRRIIGQVWKVKKPKNNYAKYGAMRLLNSRFMYTLGMAQTETGRAGSNRHPFKFGTNAQNVPNGIRHIVRADEGYFLFEPDFGASDARFVAYESGDQRMIDNLESDRDTHCIHAAHFFKKPYEEIYAGYKEKADWVVDSLRGVRQNAKRVGHGSNYQMSEFTLYVTMGKEAVVAAAEALQARYVVVERTVGALRSKVRYLHIPAVHGFEYRGKLLENPILPAAWSQRELVQLCGFMLEDYHTLYTGLRPWFRRIIEEAVKNHNLVTCAFGRTRLFFGDIRKDNKIQRELTAYYGQGGTAGNINRCFHKLYYEREYLADHGAMVLSQTHDSMLFMVPVSKLHVVPPRILTVMEEPFTIRGRTLRIPADGKIGFTWGEKNMLSYSPDLTLEVLIAKEAEVRSKFS
jgi:DNA polymerase I-like protein with 3'-5' exonuclease and polymerase domains